MTKDRFIAILMTLGVSSGVAGLLWALYSIKECTDAGQTFIACLGALF